MNDLLKIAVALLSGYLLGSINTAVIVGKFYGKDVKSLGSKSGGLTNALRVLGRTAAAFVLIGDVLKGVVACLIGLRLGVYVHSGNASDCITLLLGGAGAIIGHNWPVYFGFKGGKGALTAITVLFMFDWEMALICLGLFFAIVAATRYVSLGTIIAVASFVLISLIPAFGHTLYFQLVTCPLALMIIAKHHENIRRLLAGSESKLAF